MLLYQAHSGQPVACNRPWGNGYLGVGRDRGGRHVRHRLRTAGAGLGQVGGFGPWSPTNQGANGILARTRVGCPDHHSQQLVEQEAGTSAGLAQGQAGQGTPPSGHATAGGSYPGRGQVPDSRGTSGLLLADAGRGAPQPAPAPENQGSGGRPADRAAQVVRNRADNQAPKRLATLHFPAPAPSLDETAFHPKVDVLLRKVTYLYIFWVGFPADLKVDTGMLVSLMEKEGALQGMTVIDRGAAMRDKQVRRDRIIRWLGGADSVRFQPHGPLS